MSVYCDPLGNCIVTVTPVATGALPSEPPLPLGGGLDYFPPAGPAAQIGTGAAPPVTVGPGVVSGRPTRQTGGPTVAAPPPIAAPGASNAPVLEPFLAALPPFITFAPGDVKSVSAPILDTEGNIIGFRTTPLGQPPAFQEPSTFISNLQRQQLAQLLAEAEGLPAPAEGLPVQEAAPFELARPTAPLSEAGQLELFGAPKPSLAPVISQVADIADLTLTGGLVRSATTVLGLIGKVFAGPVSLLMQPTEAGIPAAQEAALVEQQLTPGTFPTPPVTGTTGLPNFVVPTVPDVGPSVVVSAPRIEAPVFVDPSLRFGPQLLGDVPLSGVRGSPAPGSRPSTRPATGVQTQPGVLQQLASGLLGETAGPGPSRFPGERGRQQLGPLALPGTSPRMAKPPINTGTEQCQPKQRQQQKKKKQPRQVCYRGTYVELSHGLIKHRREKIPCR